MLWGVAYDLINFNAVLLWKSCSSFCVVLTKIHHNSQDVNQQGVEYEWVTFCLS